MSGELVEQECGRCGDEVLTLSSDGLCDGCVEIDARRKRVIKETLDSHSDYIRVAGHHHDGSWIEPHWACVDCGVEIEEWGIWGVDGNFRAHEADKIVAALADLRL